MSVSPAPITGVSDTTIAVSFDEVGPEVLDAEFCWSEGGLEIVGARPIPSSPAA